MTAPGPTDTAELRYVLMKRGLYWCPEGYGYTGVLAEAGRYTEVYARYLHDHDSGTTMRLASECDEFAPACWPEMQVKHLTSQRDAAQARIVELDTALASARETIAALGTAARSQDRLRHEVERERDRLETALRDAMGALCRLPRAADAKVSEILGDPRVGVRFEPGGSTPSVAALSPEGGRDAKP